MPAVTHKTEWVAPTELELLLAFCSYKQDAPTVLAKEVDF